MMLQNWRDLTFLHFSCEPSAIQPLIPPEFTVDTFDGRAWVGLVLFRMRDIRVPSMPSPPWLGAFPETNVRTYVHRDGAKPGVWFFSLDAARWLACMAARSGLGLPYVHAKMSVVKSGSEVAYRSSRSGGSCSVRGRIQEEPLPKDPGGLNYFLIERYLLYSRTGRGLIKAQVHHRPYPIQQAELISCEQTLTKAAGLPSLPWEHICYSQGVDVEVFSRQGV